MIKLEKYTGRTVTIIYMNRQNGFTKRRIKILAVDGDKVRAFCHDRRAPRTFLLDSILAVEPVPRRRAVV
ncbi:WYL domain-containing protein [Paenibacillus alkalitolerans]|uniref:WYL domain-containing protein n=1 Tax=Paenibacillus alkalitolerans TaxID=2799335 RepID=UPI0018F3BA1D|nr:WYL domain-containing protein [Paenibacillus alkalitolerans]